MARTQLIKIHVILWHFLFLCLSSANICQNELGNVKNSCCFFKKIFFSINFFYREKPLRDFLFRGRVLQEVKVLVGQQRALFFCDIWRQSLLSSAIYLIHSHIFFALFLDYFIYYFCCFFFVFCLSKKSIFSQYIKREAVIFSVRRATSKLTVDWMKTNFSLAAKRHTVGGTIASSSSSNECDLSTKRYKNQQQQQNSEPTR